MIGVIASSFIKPILDGLILDLDASDSNSYPGSGTTWYDISGAGNHATLVNGVGYSTTYGGEMVFSNASPYDYVSGSMYCNKTNYTVEWWIRPASMTNYNQFMSFNTINSWGAFAMHTAAGGSLYIGTSGTSRFTNLYPYPYVLNTWRHLVFTFENGVAKFYVNGILKFTASPNLALATANNFSSYYLGNNTSSTLNGLLGLFRVYSNLVLNSTEVLERFDNTKTRFGL